MTGWRRLAKGLTPALLTLWVAFVVLGTVQPCCEAVADTFMAGGPVSSTGHRHEVMEEAHQPMVGGAEPIHTHCGQTLQRHAQLKALNANETGTGNEVHAAATAVAAAPPVPAAATRAVRDRAANERERSPPLPVYLATLRLRL